MPAFGGGALHTGAFSGGALLGGGTLPAAYASDLNGLVADVGDRPNGFGDVTDLKARAPATRAWRGLKDAHTLADEAQTLADAAACAASVPATRAWRGLEDRGAGVGWGGEGGEGGGGGEGDWDGEEYSEPEHVHTSAFHSGSAQPAGAAGCVISARTQVSKAFKALDLKKFKGLDLRPEACKVLELRESNTCGYDGATNFAHKYTPDTRAAGSTAGNSAFIAPA